MEDRTGYNAKKKKHFNIKSKLLIRQKGVRWFIGLNQILEDNDLEHQEKLLFFLIWSLSYDRGYCYAANQLLQDKLKLGKTQMSGYVNSLQTKGYVEILQSPDVPMREIHINFKKLFERGRRIYTKTKTRKTEHNRTEL